MNLLFLNLVQTELYKIFRKGRSYIGFGAIAFIVIVIQIALFVDGESYLELGTQSLKDSFTFQGNLLNGYLSVFIILSSLWVHIPFLIALVAGDLIAGEAVEAAAAARAHQGFLAAAGRLVREVPGLGPVLGQRADAVVVADDGRAVGAAGPGLARGVGLRCEGGAVGA